MKNQPNLLKEDTCRKEMIGAAFKRLEDAAVVKDTATP
jgi:hypothetical protein